VIAPSSAFTATVTNNTLTANLGPALTVLSDTGPSVASITDNAFSTSLSSSLGYAATLTNTSASTLCLDFVHNQAFPIRLGAVAPFSFANTGGGTLNLTPASTQANNIGLISFDGATPSGCTFP
jgi:hypothetical protein